MFQRHVLNLSIACPIGDAYEYLADPANYPAWAAVDASTYRQVNEHEWEAEMEFGRRRVRFTPRNDFAVLDHAIYREGDEPVTMPMRLIPNGDGCDLTFVFFRRPGTSDTQFASAIEWVTTDFLVLKALLEGGRR